jgi:hypothetical protein
MEKSRDINRSEGDQRGVGGGERERRQRRDDGSRSEVYFRQDHPIVKRTEIYSRSVPRGGGRASERERERGNIKSSALSRHRAPRVIEPSSRIRHRMNKRTSE